ncbi:MAG: LytTR family transcriptional regulator [Bacteroidetes bacterium]|nr:MAG: LytTR family transcriptional regulator [Bacteroidota bacterium]
MQTRTITFIHSPRFKLTLSLSQGFFSGLFMLVFLPFGINNYDPHHSYTWLFIGVICQLMGVIAASSLLLEFLIKPLFHSVASLTFAILWTLASYIPMSQACFLFYNYLGNWHDFRLSSAVEFYFNCLSVFLFPTVGVFVYFNYAQLRSAYQSVLTNIESQIAPEDLLTFRGQGANGQLTVAIDKFFYAQAQDNYVELKYLHQGKVAKFLMRASISKLAETVKSPVVRTHRSFLVNLYQVKMIRGNDADTRLSLEQISEEIPVSKTYRTQVMQELRKLKNFG